MSAALRFPPGVGLAGLRMTAREFFALGETDENYELIDGVVVMSPHPALPHQDLLKALIRQLDSQAESLPGVRVVLDTDIQFSESTVYRPDISVYANHRLVGSPLPLDIIPDLAIEILSPSSHPRDLITKRDDYARFGVAEYWVLEPGSAAVQVFRITRRSAKFTRSTLTRGSLISTAVPGLSLEVSALGLVSGRAGPRGRRKPG
jgi:Uma2 family endonuclease